MPEDIPPKAARRWLLHGTIWLGVMLVAMFAGKIAGWRPGAVAIVLALAFFIGMIVTLSTRETTLSKVVFAALLGLALLVIASAIIFAECGISIGPELF